MEGTKQEIPAPELERMMKIQEVILKAMAGKLKWWEAAEIIGVTDRTKVVLVVKTIFRPQ